MIYLEDYRHNELGASFLILSTKPQHKIFLTYDLHITKAFYATINDLIELENSKNSMLGTGSQTHASISFWFLGLESFINTLLKIGCLKKGLDFREYKDRNLSSRLTLLLDILELDKIKFYKTGILPKLNELCNFRNELFHDGNFANKTSFIKTHFSEIPFLSNQVDTFQTILILLEITQLLRYAIAGIDLIPNTILTNRITASWETLDVSYNKILKPSLVQILNKHNLSVRLNLEMSQLEPLRSNIFKSGEVQPLFTAEQEERYFVNIDETDTTICKSVFQNFMNAKNYPKNHFTIANRVIKSK